MRFTGEEIQDIAHCLGVDQAVAFIKAGGRGLWGLVNNAGVAALGTVAETTQKDLDFQFGVNVFGVHRVTRAQAGAGDGEVSDEERQEAEGIAKYGAEQPEPDAVAAAVAAAVQHALFSESPKRRYMVTPDQEQAMETLKHALRRAAELNDKQEFSYTRDELVRMLDEALGAL